MAPGGCCCCYLLAVLLCCVLLRLAAASCDPKRLESCAAMLQTAVGSNQLLFVTDHRQLDHICEAMYKGLTCIEEYISPCFTPQQKDTYMKLSSDSYDVINDLCNPGKIRDEYLRYTVECFSRGSHEYKLCGNSFRVLTEDPSAQDTPEQVELYKVDTCCAYSRHTHCVIMKVAEMCGEKVRRFVQDLIHRSSNAFTQSHCRNMTFGSDWCSGARRRRRPLNLLVILIVTAISSVTLFTSQSY